MTRLMVVAAGCAVLATAALVAAERAQLPIPGLPGGLPTTKPSLRLPTLSDLFGGNPVTSTLDDAVSDVPFLDRFNPEAAAPLLELPFGFNAGVTLVPGVWEAELQSYCLLAGSYGPTRGDGYLWAPWKGPKADVITAVLDNAAIHPEIPQQDIQQLLWAILARTKVSTLSEGPKAAADMLLTRTQVSSVDGSALDVIPSEWLDRITGPVAEPVRRVLEAENRMREAFADPAGAAYEELEAIAVLPGAPPARERGRDVPEVRWSYLPGGVFIRYKPKDYTDTVLQVYAPEPFNITRDGGRLTRVRDAAGTQLQIEYAGAAIARATLTPASGSPRPLTLTAANDQAAAAARNAVASATRLVPAGRRQAARQQDVADLSAIASRVQDEQATNFLSRAWASAVDDWAQGRVSASARAFDRVQIAPVSFGARAVAPAAAMDWFGGGGGGGFSGGSGGGMPGGGRQRNGTTLAKHSGDSAADKARRAVSIGKFTPGKHGKPPLVPGAIGFAIPDYLFGRILDFNFDMWDAVSDALQGDPPRPDFREFTQPEATVPPRAAAAPGLSAAQLDHLNALSRDLAAANAWVRAGTVAMDRHGGAVQAGDRAWAAKQAQALIYLKRGAGEQALKVAADLEILARDVAALPAIPLDRIEADRRRLDAGWSDADRQAAAAAGVSAADLEAIRQARLAVDLPDEPVTPADLLTQLAARMRELGAHFASLPPTPAPWAPPAVARAL